MQTFPLCRHLLPVIWTITAILQKGSKKRLAYLRLYIEKYQSDVSPGHVWIY